MSLTAACPNGHLPCPFRLVIDERSFRTGFSGEEPALHLLKEKQQVPRFWNHSLANDSASLGMTGAGAVLTAYSICKKPNSARPASPNRGRQGRGTLQFLFET